MIWVTNLGTIRVEIVMEKAVSFIFTTRMQHFFFHLVKENRSNYKAKSYDKDAYIILLTKQRS